MCCDENIEEVKLSNVNIFLWAQLLIWENKWINKKTGLINAMSVTVLA